MVANWAVTPADLSMEGASRSAGDMATLMSPTMLPERSLTHSTATWDFKMKIVLQV